MIISGCSGPFIKHWPKDGPWIALIKRGDCTFSQKIKNAESLNASGVLVYDHDSGTNLFMKNRKIEFIVIKITLKKFQAMEAFKA